MQIILLIRIYLTIKYSNLLRVDKIEQQHYNFYYFFSFNFLMSARVILTCDFPSRISLSVIENVKRFLLYCFYYFFFCILLFFSIKYIKFMIRMKSGRFQINSKIKDNEIIQKALFSKKIYDSNKLYLTLGNIVM